MSEKRVLEVLAVLFDAVSRMLKFLLGERWGILCINKLYNRAVAIREKVRPEDENYQRTYGYVSYENKRVLDVGAGWLNTRAPHSSTPNLFINKGAKTVIAVEGDKKLFKQLSEIAEKNENIKPLHLWISSKNHFEMLIKETKPDIVKVDCEGCEEYLLHVNRETFGNPKFYIVETHTGDLTKRFLEKFMECGYKVFLINNWWKTPPKVTIIYAQK